MSRKAFHISVDFDIHAVTCPGVWLCPKGVIMLRVAMFGLSENTKTLKPCFPLLFHERFRFKKLLKMVHSLSNLVEVLKCRNLHMQLVHLANGPNCCPATVLASFKSPLINVFYPSPNERGLNVGTDVDLLLDPLPAFPGIISPKVEISTKIVIEEVINYMSPLEDTWIINPVTITSKKFDKTENENVINRQKPVCHATKNGAGDNAAVSGSRSCNCYGNSKTNVDGKQNGENQKPPFLVPKFPVKNPLKSGSTHDKYKQSRSYKTKLRNRFKNDQNFDEVLKIDESPEKLPYQKCLCSCFQIAVVENSGVTCDCMVCKKYNDYFQRSSKVQIDHLNSTSSSDDNDRHDNARVDRSNNNAMLETNLNRDTNPDTDRCRDLNCSPPSKSKERKSNVYPKLKQLSKVSSPMVTKETSSTLQKFPASGLNTNCNKKKDYQMPNYGSELSNVPETESDVQIPKKSSTCDHRTLKSVGKTEHAISEKKINDKCHCGIYSCKGESRKNISLYPPAVETTVSSANCLSAPRKSRRQLFYKNLEDYYKKLYDKTKQQSTTEQVHACA